MPNANKKAGDRIADKYKDLTIFLAAQQAQIVADRADGKTIHEDRLLRVKSKLWFLQATTKIDDLELTRKAHQLEAAKSRRSNPSSSSNQAPQGTVPPGGSGPMQAQFGNTLAAPNENDQSGR